MIDGETSFYSTTVSGDIDVVVCYDGVVMVDGKEIFNIFDITTAINDKLLKEIHNLNYR
jgi:hypothetical protein